MVGIGRPALPTQGRLVDGRFSGWQNYFSKGSIRMKKRCMSRAMRGVSITLAVMVATMPSAANAEPSAKDLIELIERGGLYETTGKFVLQTYYDSYMWANVYVEMQTNKQGHIYCPPPNMVMQTEQVQSILIRYLKDHPNEAEKPAGLVVMMSLQDTFNCS